MPVLKLKPIFTSNNLEKYKFQWEIPDWENIRDSELHVTSQKLIFETEADESSGLQTRWLVGLKAISSDFESNSNFAQLYWQLLDINGVDKYQKLKVTVHTQLLNNNVDQDYSDVKKTTVGLGDTIDETSYEILEICNAYRYSDIDLIFELDGSIRYSLVLIIEKPSPNKTVECDSLKVGKFSMSSAKQLSENFAAILEDSSSSDIKIVTSDGVEFPAHKIILKARCPVFAGMFNADLTESRNGIVETTDISGKTMKILLTYFYSGKLLPNWRDDDTIVEFTYAAGKYQMAQVLVLLDDNLGDSSDVKTDAAYVDVQLLNLAGKMSLVNAEKRLLHRVLAKINKINNTDELFELLEIEKDVILEKAKQKLDASTVLKIWGYACGNKDDQVIFNSNALLILAWVSSDSTLKSVEMDLLKRFAETVSNVRSTDQLFEIIGSY